MELWIRSQSGKSLLKTDNFYIDDSVQREEGYTYIKCCAYDEWLSIAKYDTKKRALEILDEIQKLLQPQILCKKGKIAGSFDNTIIREADGFEIKELSTYVYEMPKE